MNITIVGPGAIGSLWACKLQQAGHTVGLWQRRASQPQGQLQLDEQATRRFSLNDSNALSQSDLVLVTVKAWQVEQAITPLLTTIHPDAVLVFMHNGMGALDELANKLSGFPVLLATTTQAAYKPSAEQVQHTGLGITQLGAWNEKGRQCDFIADVFNHALAQSVWNPDINQALWQKLAINCAINPLTALHQCRNGELAQPQYASQLDAIIDEVCQVIKLESVALDAVQIKQTVHQVILATAENFSSMQQDIAHQRRSEIDFITGYVVKCAQRHQLALPENSKLLKAIQQIEHSWSQL